MKSGRNPEDVYQEIKDIGVQDISMEVVGTDWQMIDEGRRLSKKFGEVATIKLPCTKEGLFACKVLSEEGIRINVTLIFCAAQAVLASKAGASYVSPFVGRLDDQSVAVLKLFGVFLSYTACIGEALKFLLLLSDQSKELLGPGITELKLQQCPLRYLSKCTSISSQIKALKSLTTIKRK